LDAAYALRPGKLRKEAIVLVRMTDAPLFRSGSDFCTVNSTPRALTSKLWLKLSMVTSASFTLSTAPTLATTTSSLRPSEATLP
jgi:hypothetical protein